jgi:hypothetical protein
MALEVVLGEDPGWALHEAGEFLAADPVPHNLILTLLNARVAYPEPGRYWLVRENSAVVGMAFQSPLDFFAILTTMGPGPISALVEAVVEAGVNLPGVNGEAGTAARFAGQWAERRGSAAFPVDGQRVYELRGSPQGTPAEGHLRQACLDDLDLLISWMHDFLVEIGEDTRGLAPMMKRRVEAGHFWVWENGGPVSMAATSEQVEGVVRVQAVYTPPERRNRGHAGACVAGLSRRMQDAGHRCILYTDLGNPTSNSVYRRIGYRAVREGLRYRFD